MMNMFFLMRMHLKSNYLKQHYLPGCMDFWTQSYLQASLENKNNNFLPTKANGEVCKKLKHLKKNSCVEASRFYLVL